MERTIAILNRKGGVGKTTTAINLGGALNMLGKKVLLVDLDPQFNASTILGFNQGDGPTIFESLVDKERKTPLPYYEYKEGYDLVPGSGELDDIESYLPNTRVGVTKILKKLLSPLKDEYDFIIIDCAPNIGILSVNAMMAADGVIIPVDRQLSLEGATDIMAKIEEVREENENLKIEGFLLTKYKRRINAVTTTKNAIESFGVPVFNARIRENEELSKMVEYRECVYWYNSHCNGAEDYMQLAREVGKIRPKSKSSK